MIAVKTNNLPARRALSQGTEAPARARARASSPARRRERPRFGAALVALGAVVALALAYVGETAAATQSSYQISGLKAQQAALLAQQQQIRYQISLQTSAGRLDGEANVMGMVRPTAWKYVAAGSARVALLHTEPDSTPAETRSLFDSVAAALGEPTTAEARGR